jgi:hypothetical protein
MGARHEAVLEVAKERALLERREGTSLLRELSNPPVPIGSR